MNIDQAAAREARNIMHGYIIPTLQHEAVTTQRDGNKVKQTTVMDNGVVMDKWEDTMTVIDDEAVITKDQWDALKAGAHYITLANGVTIITNPSKDDPFVSLESAVIGILENN